MNNMKKMMADQQKINEAVKKILQYFGTEVPYTSLLELMLDAQAQIIALMEMAKNQAAISNPHEEIETDEITQFLCDVRCYLRLLKPFAEMVGQAGFANDKED